MQSLLLVDIGVLLEIKGIIGQPLSPGMSKTLRASENEKWQNHSLHRENTNGNILLTKLFNIYQI